MQSPEIYNYVAHWTLMYKYPSTTPIFLSELSLDIVTK